MLTLHLEAENHQALVALAIKTLDIVAVEKCELNAPQAITVAPAPAAAAAPVVAAPAPALSVPVELPAPAPRAPRKRRAAPTPPVAAPAATSTEAPAAAATAPTPQASAPAVAAPAASASSSTAVPAGAAPVIPTIDEVRYALGEVNGVFGMAVCTSLLEQYGAQRVSLVPEAKRADFIKECQAKVAKHKADQAAAAAAKPA
jgi:translation initiation factor IF-2